MGSVSFNHNASIRQIESLVSGDRIKISVFALIVLLSLITKNAIISLLLFSILILIDRRYIIPLLLVTPIIETVLLVKEGFTITRFVAIIFVGVFYIDLISYKKIRFSKTVLGLYILYIIVTIAGLFNSIAFGQQAISADWDDWVVVITFIKAGMPKILISIMLYIFFSKKNKEVVLEHLKICVYSISISIIITSVYFIYYGNTGTFWYGLIRLSFQDADPNEYACMLIALTCFPMVLLLTAKSINDYIIGFLSLCVSLYSMIRTLSRTGFLTACVLVIIAAIWSFKSGWKVARLFIVTAIAFSLLILSSSGMELKSMSARFLGYRTNSEISSMTAGRTDLWRSGLAATGEGPFWGKGGSRITSMWVNQKALGQSSVMHSLYLEILVQYGLIGFSVFMGLVFLAYKTTIERVKQVLNSERGEWLYLPSITLLLLLFAAISLSWEWSELVWYFLGITLGVGNMKDRVQNHSRFS